MFIVDTNVFLYAAIREFPQHEKAWKLVDFFRNEGLSWHSTWGIFYEFLRVSTHRAVFVKPLTSSQAWNFLQSIIASPGFSFLAQGENYAESLNRILAKIPNLAGNLWHDAHIVAVMMDHGIREIYTADSDFNRFSEIKVINPF